MKAESFKALYLFVFPHFPGAKVLTLLLKKL